MAQLNKTILSINVDNYNPIYCIESLISHDEEILTIAVKGAIVEVSGLVKTTLKMIGPYNMQ